MFFIYPYCHIDDGQAYCSTSQEAGETGVTFVDRVSNTGDVIGHNDGPGSSGVFWNIFNSTGNLGDIP